MRTNFAAKRQLPSLLSTDLLSMQALSGALHASFFHIYGVDPRVANHTGIMR